MPITDVKRIVGGGHQYLALTKNGDVYFWGSVSQTVANMPVRRAVSDVVDISASSDESCSLERSGTVTCWDPEGAAKAVGVLPLARKLAHSTQLACALLDGGRVACWRPGESPRLRSDVTDATDIASAGDRTCSLGPTGVVRCWGTYEPALPIQTALPHPARRLVGGLDALCVFGDKGLPVCVDQRLDKDPRFGGLRSPHHAFDPATELESLSIAEEHACAVVAGRAHCWGDESFGRIGRPDVNADYDVRVRVSLGDTASLSRVKGFSAGAHHRCAVIDDGTLRCWGKNDHYQLGLRDRMRDLRTGPTLVPNLTGVAQVAVNDASTCVVTVEGMLSCFGDRWWFAEHGSHDRDVGGSLDPPARIAKQVARVGLGDGFGCFVAKNRHAYCWGRNDLGQLGTGDGRNSESPLPVQTSAGRPLQDVVTLRVFPTHACAITERGALQCWGNNPPFVQGRPYNTPLTIPVATPVSGLPAVSDVSDRCVLSRSGELYCWGYAFADEEQFSYEPRRMGVCGVKAIESGPGMCFADAHGATCFGASRWVGETKERGGFRIGLSQISSMTGTESELCAVDERGGLHCVFGEDDVLPMLGDTPADWIPWPASQKGCPRDEPLRTTPSFPPMPFESVVALTRGPLGEETGDTGVTLTPKQASVLIGLLNDPESYTSLATCHNPRHAYEFRDRIGRRLAEVSVGNCTTLDAFPHIPTQVRSRGNIITPKLRAGLDRLCKELRLEGCGD
jgi:alpha-tubulin suppressor-like RCC1 family protein